MNFTISVETLKSILKKLDKFYKSKSGDRTKRIKCICTDESLSIQTQVSEQTVRLEYKLEDFGIIAHETGATVLEYPRLKAMVETLPNKEIAEFHLDNKENVILSCGRSRFKFATESPDTFRDVKRFEGGSRFRFNANELVAALNACTIAVDEKQKYPLCGVYIGKSDEEGKIDVVGCDLKIMCRAKIECVDYPENYKKGIVISKVSAIACAGLYETCYDEEGHVDFLVNENMCIIDDGQTSYYIGLLDGTYPAFQKLFQTDDSWGSMLVNKEEFLAAIKQVSLATTEEYPGALITFDDDSLDIKSASPEYGEARTLASCVNAPVGKMKFDTRLLLVCFPFNLETVTIKTPPKLNKQIIINPEGSIQFLVMPLAMRGDD